MLKSRFLSRAFYKLHVLTKPDRYQKLLATDEDYGLVSYPRSGNTWLRAMIAELVFGESGESIKELQYYVPDIHAATLKAQVIASKFRVFKSHERLFYECYQSPTFKKVIYLLRDPRDVVISYFRYWENLWGYRKGFDIFFWIG